MPCRVVIVGERLHSYKGYRLPALVVLEELLSEINLKPAFMGIRDIQNLRKTDVVVALGNDAAYAVVPDWTGTCEERRGYIWEGINNTRVIVTKHPEVLTQQWIPWRALISYDLQRAKEEAALFSLQRPERNVTVIGNVFTAKQAADALRRCERVAFDIEISSTTELLCIGFATDSGNAIVFPARFSDYAFGVLRDGRVGKIAQNGQFDLHFLLTRCNVEVQGQLDDTMIGWHCCYPELAGGQQEELTFKRKGAKRTHKSLAFFASLFTKDEWWKDYETDEAGMFVLNGKDCCITFECMLKIEDMLRKLNNINIYRHEMSLVRPCVMMQARGLTIDDNLRQEREQQLEERLASAGDTLSELILPFLQERLDETHPAANLFYTKTTCACCRNGKQKRDECWECAGFDKKPGKKLLDTFGPLTPCAKCNGAGSWTTLSFNPRSSDQKRVLLYDLLKLPKRYTTTRSKDGTKRTSLSTDEDALKGLLAIVSA